MDLDAFRSQPSTQTSFFIRHDTPLRDVTSDDRLGSIVISLAVGW